MSLNRMETETAWLSDFVDELKWCRVRTLWYDVGKATQGSRAGVRNWNGRGRTRPKLGVLVLQDNIIVELSQNLT